VGVRLAPGPVGTVTGWASVKRAGAAGPGSTAARRCASMSSRGPPDYTGALTIQATAYDAGRVIGATQ